MNYGIDEEETGWDSLASQLGLESAPPPPPRVEKKKPEPIAPTVEPIEREEFVPKFSPRPAETALKAAPIADDESAPFGEGIVEDAADVLDDEGPEDAEVAGEGEQTEGEGKGRRRRRRRRRKKGGTETAADSTAVAGNAVAADIEETPDADLLAFPSVDEDDEADDEMPSETFTEGAADEDDDENEVEEIVPEIALAEEEEESTEPLPEWKVTAWTDLIATLYRPQDR